MSLAPGENVRTFVARLDAAVHALRPAEDHEPAAREPGAETPSAQA